ncbi:LuxR C-terminal-related transcriptional regulator [Dactylosporangium sp. CA-152071]|uniref:helix-turn-helix transcriptional regulator n=1 Tax=Dactylosporangium sp. CA-152071 TaxID=3239933 RepID=UPI003D93D36F
MRRPFVARDPERAVVERTITGAEPGGALLIGPAGIGKSRLADEVVTAAGRQGHHAMRVHASEAARELPLGALGPLLPAQPPKDVAAVLRALVPGHGRGLLFVDDVDLLDPMSAAAVHQIVANGLLDVVATVRAGVELPAFVTALMRTGRLERVDLGPLTAAGVAELVAAVLDGPVSSITVAHVQRLSAGNPLYVHELLTDAVESGALAVVDGLWHLRQLPAASPRLTDLLNARLRSTSRQERLALELLAIAGQLGLSQVYGLSDHDAVEGLERRGLITVRQDGRRTHAALAHPLYGEILRTTLPVSVRLRHSRTLADLWERTGARRREDLLRWAVWRLTGGGPVNAAWMTEAARLATLLRARVAVRERLARHAWRATGAAEAGLLLAAAQFDAGRSGDGYAVLDRIAATAGTDEDRAGAALAQAFYLGWGAGRLDEALATLERAGTVVTDPQWRAALTTQRSMLLAASGAPDDALALLEPVLGADGALTLQASAAGGLAYMLAGRFPEAIRLARRAHRLATSAERAHQDIGVLPGLAGLCVRVTTDAGHVADARRFGETVLRTAASKGDAHGLAWITAGLASLELPAGDLEAARGHAIEAAAYFRQVSSPIGLGWVLAIGLLVAVHEGDPARAATIAAELAATRPEQRQVQLYHYEIDRALAWHETLTGDPERARHRLAARARHWWDRGALLPGVVLCNDLARLGGARQAAAILGDVPPGWPLGEAVAAFVRAMAGGDGPGLEAAARRFDELGFTVYAADAAAAAWAVKGSVRDVNRLAAAVAAYTARCPGLRTPLLAAVDAEHRLTPREREIASLAAAGFSNRDIAERLTLSFRTVENHLARVYLKLGLHGRNELSGAPPRI